MQFRVFHTLLLHISLQKCISLRSEYKKSHNIENLSSISDVQMVVESQPEAPQTQELHQWQSQKEHNKNKEKKHILFPSVLYHLQTREADSSNERFQWL